MGTKTTRTIKVITTLFLIAGVSLLFLPLIQMKLQFLPDTTAGDNRTLNPKPDLTWEGLNSPNPKTYIERYDSYFQDHYGLRNWLINWNAHFYYYNLHLSPIDTVVIGKDGFLFYDYKEPYGMSLPDFEGHDLMTPGELKKAESKLLDWKNEFDRRGIKFLVVMPPNKHTIYPEKLPNYVQKGSVTRADQLDRLIPSLGIEFIDLRPILLEKKRQTNDLLYYLNDTHWNNLGAFYGYQVMAAKLRTMFPTFHEVLFDDLSFSVSKIKDVGDCAKMINLFGELEDYKVSANFKNPPQAVKSPLSEEDKLWYFDKNNPKLPRAVIFRDSFSSALQPYLSEGFSRSVYVWQKEIDFNIIDKEKPDVVIYEILERFTKYFAK